MEKSGAPQKNPMKNVLCIHAAVLFFSLSGVIGKSVTAPAVMVTLGRVLFSSLLLLGLLLRRKTRLRLESRRDYFLALAAGAVLALHWTSFMQSVQSASVAVGTITFSTFPLFAAFLEPLVFHEKLRAKNLLLALMMLVGVLVLLPPDGLKAGAASGVLWGMCSSFTYAVLALLNRALSARYDGALVCFYQQGTAALLLLPALFFIKFEFLWRDLGLVALLGVLCTALAQTLFVAGLKGVRVQTAGLISGMESVYGILLALLLLGEVPGPRELVGGGIVLGVSMASTFTKDR